MSGDGTDDITIPAVFMKKDDASLLRDLLQVEKSVYVLLTWIPGLEPGMGMEKEKQQQQEDGDDEKGGGAMKEKEEGVVNGGNSGEELRSGESGLYDSGLELDHKQPRRDSVQTCSSTADCHSPSDSP